ncbi:acyl carrier protein [Paenibacillus sp. HW567]|uniref:acyl carrier protein n=1 Tax=Paenibacillus sp. HW567 TaxID=1034769 RepID=UPI0003628134|nr:acyl carrier protein [Paenibacillus sp. HW567]
MDMDKAEDLNKIITIINGILKMCLGNVPELDRMILEVDGNSLQLTRIAASIQQELGIDFQVVHFFMYPTVFTIANHALAIIDNKKSLEGDH